MFQFEPYFFLQLHLSFLSLKFFCFTLEYRWFTVLCCFFLIIIFFVSFSPCLFTSHSSGYHSLVQCINWLCFFVKGMPCALRHSLCCWSQRSAFQKKRLYDCVGPKFLSLLIWMPFKCYLCHHCILPQCLKYSKSSTVVMKSTGN